MSWIEDVIEFRGHKSIRATHKTTFEITTDHHLTENGDCIVGVGASKGCSQLNEKVRSLIMRSDPIVKILIEFHGHQFSAQAKGNPDLTLDDSDEIVIRKSSFTSPRTLAILCNKAAIDIPRAMVKDLQDPGKVGKLRICVENDRWSA